MVAILFEERGRCAVLEVDETANDNIAFAMGNSWRGDDYEDTLRKAIIEWDKQEEKKFLDRQIVNEVNYLREHK